MALSTCLFLQDDGIFTVVCLKDKKQKTVPSAHNFALHPATLLSRILVALSSLLLFYVVRCSVTDVCLIWLDHPGLICAFDIDPAHRIWSCHLITLQLGKSTLSNGFSLSTTTCLAVSHKVRRQNTLKCMILDNQWQWCEVLLFLRFCIVSPSFSSQHLHFICPSFLVESVRGCNEDTWR